MIKINLWEPPTTIPWWKQPVLLERIFLVLVTICGGILGYRMVDWPILVQNIKIVGSVLICNNVCEDEAAPPVQKPTVELAALPQPEPTPAAATPQGMAEQLAALVATIAVETAGDERKIKEWGEAFLRLPLRHLSEQEREKIFAIMWKAGASWQTIFLSACYQTSTCTTFEDEIQRFFYERQIKGGDTERAVYNYWTAQFLRALGDDAAYKRVAEYTLKLLETTAPAYEAMYRAHLPKPETP